MRVPSLCFPFPLLIALPQRIIILVYYPAGGSWDRLRTCLGEELRWNEPASIFSWENKLGNKENWRAWRV